MAERPLGNLIEANRLAVAFWRLAATPQVRAKGRRVAPQAPRGMRRSLSPGLPSHARLAQSAERRFRKPQVARSIRAPSLAGPGAVPGRAPRLP